MEFGSNASEPAAEHARAPGTHGQTRTRSGASAQLDPRGLTGLCAFMCPLHTATKVSTSCNIITSCLRGHGVAARDRLATQLPSVHPRSPLSVGLWVG